MKEKEIREKSRRKAEKITEMINREVCENCTRYEECPIEYECNFLKCAKKIVIRTLEIVLRDDFEHIYDNEPREEDDDTDD